MFQQELACMAVSTHNVHEEKHAGRIQEGGTGLICFEDITGYVKRLTATKKVLVWCKPMWGKNT
jgi:hypothetical protein